MHFDLPVIPLQSFVEESREIYVFSKDDSVSPSSTVGLSSRNSLRSTKDNIYFITRFQPTEDGDYVLLQAMEENQRHIVLWLLKEYFPKMAEEGLALDAADGGIGAASGCDQKTDIQKNRESLLAWVNVRCSISGDTCLMKACCNLDAEIVSLLLHLKADASLENELGQTALSLARTWGMNDQICKQIAGSIE